MSKFTPGPWAVTENTTRTKNGSWFEIDGRMTRIADIPASTNPMWDFVSGYEAGKANARLIAAAPELLEALEDAHVLSIAWASHYKFNHGLADIHETHKEILKRIEASILKATGGA